MKKCFFMFVFFVVVLLLAAMTDETEVMISETNVVGLTDAETLLAQDELLNNNNSNR